jgi:aspartate kinase
MSSDMANIHSAGLPRPLAGNLVEQRRAHSHVHRNVHRPLRVMKFGGTSVGDAPCIRQVAEIIQENAREHELVIIVSAMGGVTNKLIEAGTHAGAKNLIQATQILEQLREQHTAAAAELIDSESERNQISSTMKELFELCGAWCKNVASRGELTVRERDSISSLGERLSAPLVAAVLRARGFASQSLEATELVITDSEYGSASPQMDLTTERCESHVRPLLRRGVVPVVTGFIGATQDGALTTLGRGGSDYSATILGASLRADDVIIWTDVDGILTADPRLIRDASTIPEISYREASELAYFGAKVLHPKTLHPMMHNGIPVWIRNTFAPDKAGTKITPTGSVNTGGVKALTAVSDAVLITIEGANEAGETLGRAVAAAKSVRADVLMVSQSGARENTYMVVAAAFAQRTLEALRREFTSDLRGNRNRVSVDSAVSILTVVGEDLRAVKGIVERATSGLAREGVQILATGQGSSACHISFVVTRTHLQVALVATHREFESKQNSSQDKGSGPRECRTMTVVDDMRTADAGEVDGIRSRLNRAFSPADNVQRGELEVLDEALFRLMIARERKRSERSGKPVLLMLLDAGRFLPSDKSGRVLTNIMSALSLYTRDTDIIGWYKNNSVIGVMFTEIGIDDPGVILGTMMQRVSEALRSQLSLEKFSQISISWQVYPEHWDQESSAGNPAFYPDLEHRESSRRSALALKRFIDVVGSLAAIVFLAPVFLVVAVLVKLSSKGSILYKQQRLGQFGRPFTFLKFRSMYVNNDPKIHRDFMKRVINGEHDGKVAGEEKKVYKMTNDPRITPIGRFLRRASLDELPQFFNVVRGDMSLVGPRPPILYECQEYDAWHRRRVLEVKPGITGLWQITGRSRVRFDDMVRLDLQYTREWSIWLDLKILAKTPLAVVAGKDAF